LRIHASAARSILSNALNLRRSAIAALVRAMTVLPIAFARRGRRYRLRRRNVGARSGAIIVAVSLLPVSTEWSGAAMSLRAELVRLGLRWFVKRKIGPATTLEALRRQDSFLERLVPPLPKGTQATQLDLDGVKAVAVLTPASHRGRLVLYLHGGGHVSGSPALYGDFTWRIAAATRARTVILDHRLAPEHPFPAALDDAVTAYRALVADGADPRRMAVLGLFVFRRRRAVGGKLAWPCDGASKLRDVPCWART